jgi:hypothetical protein
MARRQTARTQRVVAEDPPNDSMWQRTSFWVLVFEDARKEDRWFRVERFYTATTAAQLASDIRSASRRPLDKLRVRGILPGENWTARWGSDEKCPPGNFSIWVRLLKSSD